MTLQEAVQQAAQGNVVSGLECPKCGGGRTRERSVSVWRKEGKVVLKCWRNKCGHSQEFSASEHAASGPAPKPWLARPLPLMSPLMPTSFEFLAKRYRIRRETAIRWGVRQDPQASVMYFPAYGPNVEEHRGWNARRFRGEGKKADAFPAAEFITWQAWYRNAGAKRIVVVEDQLSALRAWQLGHTAISLLGTNFSVPKYEEIARYAHGQPQEPTIHLALDADAITKTLRYALRFGGTLRPLRLWRDLKDASDEEIAACLT